jgi:predicted enzyme related to lactoylglutathione lyase
MRAPEGLRLEHPSLTGDIDSFSQKVRKAGAKIVVEKMDVPGVGQFSLFENPDGRVLGMWKQLK